MTCARAIGLAIVATVVWPGSAGAGVALDQSFGVRGVVKRVAAVDSTFALQAGADGRDGTITLSVNGGVLTRFDARGRVDPRFGTAGTARPAGLPRGEGTGSTAAIAVDRSGITATVALQSYDSSGTPPGQAVFRRRPDGSPDRRFNTGRARVLRLGGPAGGLVVDRRRRVLVAGSDGDSVSLARLRPDGRPDPTFAAEGVRHIATAGFSAPQLVAAGGVATLVDVTPAPVARVRVLRVTDDGPSSVRDYPIALLRGAVVTAARRAPRGAAVVLGRDAGGAWVLRLTRRGRLDRHFGQDGLVRLPAGWSAPGLDALADGRVVIAVQHDLGIGLLALGPDGRRARSFGPRGSAFVRTDRARDHAYYHVSVGPLSISRDSLRITLFAVGIHATGIPPDAGDLPGHDFADGPPPDLILARFRVPTGAGA